MNGSARRDALRALDGARQVIARLDSSRDAEDVAADLIDGWSAVETALRSLVGGSTLGGQALIREARQRQLISFEQANALAEFHAARDRVGRTDYRPTDGDVNAARSGFLKFESGLMQPAAEEATLPPPAAAAAAAATSGPVPMESTAEREKLAVAVGGLRFRFPLWAAALALLLVVGIGVGIWWFSTSSTRASRAALDNGIDYYRRGQREAAVGEFQKAIREDPNNSTAHVYLSRMAREVGNLTLAQQEAVAAVKADTLNPIALRELGSYMLTVGRYDDARKWLVRAVAADNSDKAAQGWLACAFVKLGRPDQAMTWFNRAGQGAWSACAPYGGATPAQGYPQAVPPQGYPQGYPPQGYPPPGYPPQGAPQPVPRTP